jgi:gas vesicle protein GvpL/GvpF
VRSHSLTAHAPTASPTSTLGPAVRQKAYLYAIIAGAQDKVYGAYGIDGHDVYSVSAGSIAAVISDFSGGSVRPERARLAAHHEVLKRLLAESTPLPISFGIVAESPVAVRRMLMRNQKTLAGQLEYLRGKVEMGLRVNFDVANIFEYFVNTHPELRVARDRLLGVNCAPTQEHKIEVGSLFDSLLTEDREAYESPAMGILVDCEFEIRVLKCRSKREVMNLACLIRREAMPRFEAAVFEVAKQFDNNFALDYNGPSAPRNFVDVELDL